MCCKYALIFEDFVGEGGRMGKYLTSNSLHSFLSCLVEMIIIWVFFSKTKRILKIIPGF